MAEHTPTPWKHYRGRLRKAFPVMINEIQDLQGRAVIRWAGFDDSDLPKSVHTANAKFIVQAVNAHEDLLAALELSTAAFHLVHQDGLEGVDDFLGCEHPLCMNSRAAIAKAKGIRRR